MSCLNVCPPQKKKKKKEKKRKAFMLQFVLGSHTIWLDYLKGNKTYEINA